MFAKISIYCGIVLLFVGISYGSGVFIQKQKQTIQVLEKVSNKQEYMQSLYEARKDDLIIRLKAEKYMPHARSLLESIARDSFYWTDGDWKSLGRQVATDYFLEYTHVPAGALYLLSNHSHGKEERIFTWEEGKQRWW